MDEPFHVIFLNRLNELRTQYISHVANGSAADFSEYKKICGAVEGISLCEREFKELLENVEGRESAGDYSDLETPSSSH